MLAAPVDSPNKCPEGYQSQRSYNEYKRITEYYCYKLPDMESEREREGRGGGGGREGGEPGSGGGQSLPGGSYGRPRYDITWEYVDRASGGLIEDLDMKKRKKKKYQAGGIASLTRDPNLGAAVNMMDGYNFGFAQGGMAAMPEYQAGGKLLRGAGDGMSDDIPAVIRGKGVQRAALADGEFVVPADVVSHLGNGSTEAGAKKLYKMMAQIRAARTGKTKQAPRVNTDKYLPRV